MNIGILTYHDGINHGSFMQCYALYHTIKNLGYDVKIINYKNFRHWYLEYKSFLYTKNPKLLLENIKKIIKFRKEQNKINKTNFSFSHNKIRRNNFDIVIIGSDEVWNFTNPVVSNDLIYFGKDLYARKIVSYATSFGWLKEDYHLSTSIIRCLKKFKSITVRDENSQKIIKNNLNKVVDVVLDPTFLYNFNGEELKCPYNDFILIYSVGFDNEIVEYIKMLAKNLNKKIISIYYKHSWCDHNVINIGPFEGLGYFKNSWIVITNKFHGTVFSIKYKKKFFSFLEAASANKIISLLSQLDLNNRCGYSITDFKNNINKNIEYEKIETNLEKQILYSKNKLHSIIRG